MLQMAGISIGNTTASAPGPGVYMFDQAFTYQGKLIGPGAPNVGGNATPVSVTSAAVGFLWVPGWEFLGAKYDAVVVQPATLADFGNPLNLMKAGVKNTYFVPAELSWKLGDSGFYVKAGLGIHAPDGAISGANGLGNIGNPWWTFQPQLIVSYLKDGWNLTALVSQEMNTKNTITDYRTGNILHAEATVAKTVGKWTLGPVAYYVGQVSDDTSSAFYHGAINTNRYNIWAAGGLVGYDFGGAVFKVWGFREFSADASGGTPVIPGIDHATQVQGWKVFANLSYRIWAPDAPVQQTRPQFYK
jgi:hypothetical protein